MREFGNVETFLAKSKKREMQGKEGYSVIKKGVSGMISYDRCD
jgi:hypothetical protein